MIPQPQRWWRGAVHDENGQQTDEGGDCFAACLASILELPIDGFPNFLASEYDGHWWHRWQMWLYENYRAELLYWEGREAIPDPKALAWWIAGVTVGGTPHSVVFYKDEFRWDPAPAAAKREWVLDDVRDGVAVFSIASIFDRADGPYQALVDANGSPVAAVGEETGA